MNELSGRTPGPLTVSAWLAAAMVAGGFVAFFLAWRGAAATLTVAVQVPYLVSGGVGGITLMIAGLTLVHVQLRRRREADEYRRLGETLNEAHAVLDALRDSARDQ